MKSKILDINGKEKTSIDLPKCFSKKIRGDIVAKILEAKKSEQPFSPAYTAGKQHSASGNIVHRRHVWKSQYGKGMSRIPRKIMSKRGSQFNWVGAETPSAVGGKRAHPPKVISRINTSEINKKEMKIGLESAISASANGKIISKRYARLNDKKIENVPFIVESKISELKTKDLLSSIKKILGNELFEIATPKKSVRKGRGKLRGRKYKQNAGLLIVTGDKEKIKTKTFEVANVKNMGVSELAKGGLGRLVLYTENAIKELNGKENSK